MLVNDFAFTRAELLRYRAPDSRFTTKHVKLKKTILTENTKKWRNTIEQSFGETLLMKHHLNITPAKRFTTN